MGGRGGFSGGGFSGGGGLNPNNIVSTTSLISEREGKKSEVDETLAVLRDIQSRYGVDVVDAEIATLKGKDGASTLAYYDPSGNVAVNKNFFDSKRMDSTYDDCIKEGFHPSRGNKTGLEATVAHEMGHRLADVAGRKMGFGNWAVDQASTQILKDAKKSLGYSKMFDVASKISGYAKFSPAEAIAEAFADVYCNGSKARKESSAIVTELNKYF